MKGWDGALSNPSKNRLSQTYSCLIRAIPLLVIDEEGRGGSGDIDETGDDRCCHSFYCCSITRGRAILDIRRKAVIVRKLRAAKCWSEEVV